MSILVTGGAGYIGSHTCILLIEAGFDVIIFDNFSNASEESIRRVEKIVNQSIPVIEGDIRNHSDLEKVFKNHNIESVIHFAGLKAVGESVEQPLKYYNNNITGTLTLCEVMAKYGCKQIVFSSSATVYGNPASCPITEDFPLSTTNPYGSSKLFVEQILRDLFISDTDWNIILLRYFNPVGAHESGTIGEDPNGIPNNLVPFITQTAVGTRTHLSIFGDDYNTPDGTGVRDYIHVMDLADGHVKALNIIQDITKVMTINLGTGLGYSVLDMVKSFEKVVNKTIPYVIAPRRSGDIATCFSNPSYAKKVLNWEATRSIDDMCADSWNWQINNPNGYRKENTHEK
jgi:UDP-glucose 4-epimerase